MNDDTKIAVVVGGSIFATISTICWAIAFANVYMPVGPPKTAKQICALYADARSSAFCIEIAKDTHQ